MLLCLKVLLNNNLKFIFIFLGVIFLLEMNTDKRNARICNESMKKKKQAYTGLKFEEIACKRRIGAPKFFSLMKSKIINIKLLI